MQNFMRTFQEFTSNKRKPYFSTPYLNQTNQKNTKTVNSIFKNAEFKCLKGKKGILLCNSCNLKQSILCGSEGCQCMQNHQSCQLQQIRFLEKFIHKKTINPRLTQLIDQKITKIINQIFQMKKKLIQNFQSKLFGLTKTDIDFLEKIQNIPQQADITGQSIKKYKKISQQERPDKLLENMDEQVKLISGTYEKLGQMLKQMGDVIIEKYQQITEKKCIFVQSDIVPTRTQTRQLLSYFDHIPQEIYDLQPVYSANVDGWSLEKFNDVCQNKPNLLYLIQNQYGKKYGAFCPCELSSDKQALWEKDESLTSFIFSLDARLKAKIIDSQYAIRNSWVNDSESYLVSFGKEGCCNLCVSSNSLFSKKKNYVWLGGGAYEQKQFNEDEVNGHYLQECKLKEFEVFQVIFKK